MVQNIFTLANTPAINVIIHGDEADCVGHCDFCSKFNRAAAKVSTVEAKNLHITLTHNEEIVGAYGRFHTWCEECSDGVNDTFWESCDWVEEHVTRKHS